MVYHCTFFLMTVDIVFTVVIYMQLLAVRHICCFLFRNVLVFLLLYLTVLTVKSDIQFGLCSQAFYHMFVPKVREDLGKRAVKCAAQMVGIIFSKILN